MFLDLAPTTPPQVVLSALHVFVAFPRLSALSLEGCSDDARPDGDFPTEVNSSSRLALVLTISIPIVA